MSPAHRPLMEARCGRTEGGQIGLGIDPPFLWDTPSPLRQNEKGDARLRAAPTMSRFSRCRGLREKPLAGNTFIFRNPEVIARGFEVLAAGREHV